MRYIFIIVDSLFVVSSSDKKNEFAKYHIMLMLGLALTGLALGLIGMIPVLGWIINIIGIFVLLYMWIMGLVNAVNGQEKPVPILGEKYLEWLKNL